MKTWSTALATLAMTTMVTAAEISLPPYQPRLGRSRAEAVVAKLGVDDWSPVHDSSQFFLGTKLMTGLLNKGLIWRHERVGIEVGPGVDEIALALTADAYSRTRRSWAYSVAPSPAPIRTRRGLMLLPDRLEPADVMLPASDGVPATQALDRALEGIAARYGEPTRTLVAVQIEYPALRN